MVIWFPGFGLRQRLVVGPVGNGGPAPGKELEDTALEFDGLKSEGGSVIGAGNFPKLLRAGGRSVDFLGMAARQSYILFVADQQDGKGPGGNSFFRRDFSYRDLGYFRAAIQQRPAERSEKSLS